MTAQDIETLLHYLRKVVVPQGEQEDFFRAVARLQALKAKQKHPV